MPDLPPLDLDALLAAQDRDTSALLDVLAAEQRDLSDLLARLAADPTCPTCGR